MQVGQGLAADYAIRNVDHSSTGIGQACERAAVKIKTSAFERTSACRTAAGVVPMVARPGVAHGHQDRPVAVGDRQTRPSNQIRGGGRRGSVWTRVPARLATARSECVRSRGSWGSRTRHTGRLGRPGCHQMPRDGMCNLGQRRRLRWLGAGAQEQHEPCDRDDGGSHPEKPKRKRTLAPGFLPPVSLFIDHRIELGQRGEKKTLPPLGPLGRGEGAPSCNGGKSLIGRSKRWQGCRIGVVERFDGIGDNPAAGSQHQPEQQLGCEIQRAECVPADL